MDLAVELFAALRERAGRPRLELAGLPEELDVAALKREIEARCPELGSLAHVSVVLGTSYAGPLARIQRGQEIALLPPVSGG